MLVVGAAISSEAILPLVAWHGLGTQWSTLREFNITYVAADQRLASR